MLDVTTGKVLWKKDARTDDGGAADIWSQVSFFHGDEMFLCQADHYLAWKVTTGELTRDIKPMVYNQRCVRTRATGKYLLGGFGTFFNFENRNADGPEHLAIRLRRRLHARLRQHLQRPQRLRLLRPGARLRSFRASRACRRASRCRATSKPSTCRPNPVARSQHQKRSNA